MVGLMDDARIAKLWQKLDVNHQGSIDVKGLKKGFRKIDHRKHCSPPTRWTPF